MNSLIAKLLTLILLISLTGCVNHQNFTPRPDTHAFGPVEKEFSLSSPVELVNAQHDDGDKIFLRSGLARFHANYAEWTEVAIQILERELVKREGSLADGAKKKIMVSVVYAASEVGFVKTETRVGMKAVLSNGYEKTYQGTNNNVMGAVNLRQVDGALMRAVAEMLNDPEVVDFLAG